MMSRLVLWGRALVSVGGKGREARALEGRRLVGGDGWMVVFGGGVGALEDDRLPWAGVASRSGVCAAELLKLRPPLLGHGECQEALLARLARSVPVSAEAHASFLRESGRSRKLLI